MKYALLKRTDGQIVIIDNSTHIGKGRIEKLCNDGAVGVGTIESNLTPGELKSGFERCVRNRNNELYYQIKLAREALDGDITWDKVHPPESKP